MSAAWVAGTVRARAMARRRVGGQGARALAGSASLAAAVDALTASPYRSHVRAGDTLEEAAHGVLATLVWNLRVLAGWLPPEGAETLRRLAGWCEITNVEQHLRALSGRAAWPTLSLGALAVAWPRLARTLSADELRAELAASPWGAVGDGTPRELQLALRLAWAERVVARVPAARAWALGAAALLMAREHFARGLPLPDAGRPAASRLLGPAAVVAPTLASLGAAVPREARWALDGVEDPDELWRAEARWWRRLHDDSARLLARPGFGADAAVGTAGLLAEDAWRVLGALAVAGRGDGGREVAGRGDGGREVAGRGDGGREVAGRGDGGREVFDAMA
jgi:hypothetical protein